MCCHSLKRQNLLVLKLMGFQLVPPGEVLSTAPMVTLEDKKTDRKPTENHKLHTKKTPHTLKEDQSKLLYLILLLLLIVNAGHVVLHAGVRDKGLRAPINQTPEDQSRQQLESSSRNMNSSLSRQKQQKVITHLCGFSPLWLSSCLVRW